MSNFKVRSFDIRAVVRRKSFFFVQTEEGETPTNIDVLKETLMVSRREINCG